VCLRDVFGNREELRHRFPRFAGVILIESGNDHAHATTRERVRHLNQVVIKKLPFIYPDDLCIRIDFRKHFSRRSTVSRVVTHLRVRNDLILRKARIYFRFEHLYFLTRNLRAAQTPDQLF
jgi:hypothetical protein